MLVSLSELISTLNLSLGNYSPSSSTGVIVVGAIDQTNAPAYFSNRGKCVSVYAPGNSIRSTFRDSDTATKIISGTSQANPMVAGVIANRLSVVGKLTPRTALSYVQSAGTPNVMGKLLDSDPDVLAFDPPSETEYVGPRLMSN